MKGEELTSRNFGNCVVFILFETVSNGNWKHIKRASRIYVIALFLFTSRIIVLTLKRDLRSIFYFNL